MSTFRTAVHTIGCRCVDCETEETVPLESASRNDLADLLSGFTANYTGLTRLQIIDHCCGEWVG